MPYTLGAGAGGRRARRGRGAAPLELPQEHGRADGRGDGLATPA